MTAKSLVQEPRSQRVTLALAELVPIKRLTVKEL